MVLDNKLRTGKLKLSFVLIISTFLFLLFYSIVEGIEKNLLYFSASMILLVGYIFMLILKLHYFYLNEENSKLVFRFYTSHPLIRTYKAFEIQKSNLADFEIRESVFGLKKELILKISTKKGTGEYPPLSISLLNKRELSALKVMLSRIIKTNK